MKLCLLSQEISNNVLAGTSGILRLAGEATIDVRRPDGSEFNVQNLCLRTTSLEVSFGFISSASTATQSVGCFSVTP